MFIRTVALVVLFTVWGCGRGAVSSPVSIPDSHIQTMISWLPADMETVIATKRPKPTSDDGGKGLPLFNALILQDSLFPKMPDLTFEYGIFSLRAPQVPRGIGIGHVSLVWIAKFDTANLSKLRTWLKANAKRIGDSYVMDVANSAAKWGFEFLEHDGLVFSSSSKEILAEVLRRKATKSERVAFPLSLEQWSHVDTNSDSWAVRQFSGASRKLPSGLNMNDPKIVGYAMQTNLKEGVFRVVSFSDDPKGAEIATLYWSYEGAKPHIRSIDARTTEFSYDAKGLEPSIPFVMIIALGIPVFI